MTGQDTVHTVPEQRMMFINQPGVDGAPASHQLRVYRNGQPTRPRIYHVVACMGPNHQLGVFNNSVSAVERALLERYFLCDVNGTFHRALEVRPSAYDTRFLRQFRSILVNYTKPLAPVLTLRQVVECYTGGKRKVYERAYNSLFQKSLSVKDSHMRSFTKFEKQALNKACRIINPRDPRMVLVLGKWLKKSEHIYFDAINQAWGAHTQHTVLKGVNVVEAAAVMRSKWERFSEPVAVGLDAKKFDMHVSVTALLYEHSVYNDTFDSKMLRKILRWQLNNKGKAYCPDGVVEFQMPGTRSSGDLNTSLGNCIIMCALIWTFCRERGIDAELCNNGDDCVVIMDKSQLAQFSTGLDTWFQTKGFRMEVEPPVDVFERIEFCQASPCWDGRQWRMVRNVRTCLMKDPMCLIPINGEVSLRRWMGAVGECGSALVPGIPVLREFYRAFSRHGLHASDRMKQHIFRTTSMAERLAGLEGDWEPTPESRASFYTMTGLTPDYQIALEDYFRCLVIDTGDIRAGGDGLVENYPPPFIYHL